MNQADWDVLLEKNGAPPAGAGAAA